MVKNKNSLKAVLFGLAILATMLLLNVAYAQETKGVELRLISKQPIEAPKKRGKVEEIKSENGKFKGIVVRGMGLDIHPIDKFTLLDSKGEKIWEKKDCGATFYIIANDGSVIEGKLVAGPSGPAVFSFYDPKGNLINCTEEIMNIGLSFLYDADYLLIRTAQNDLLVFNTKGNLIQNYGPCKKFVASPEFKNLIVFFQKELRFYRNGILVGKDNIESTPLLEGMVISTDGEYIAIVTVRSLSLYEISNAKRLWRTNATENFNFTTVDLSENAEQIVVGLDSNAQKPADHTNGNVYLLNKKGEKLTEQKIKYTKWNVLIPGVDITDDGKNLSVKTDKEIYQFELK